jgi:4-alpha-glucanotransferase
MTTGAPARVRRSGILCHPTSFPGPFGIGDFGEGAFGFVDFLHAAGQSVWQILPLGPTGYGDSPYQPFSAFAGNPLLIDPRGLAGDGLLTQDDLANAGSGDDSHVRYGDVIGAKRKVLTIANGRLGQASASLLAELAAFKEAQREWLDDYALFMALKERLNWVAWPDWEPALVRRESAALDAWREALSDEIAYHCFTQFVFERQWQRLHRYAQERGISVLGDLPIFVGHDSADVWAHQELFHLDTHGQPTIVAGVPPDYFSPTGQRWGNPLYRWDLMAEDGYGWWVRRLTSVLSRVDEVRIDHFRGFVDYWEVPASESTAIRGRWLRGPGRAFFDAVASALGVLPIIAEDLGIITSDVTELREELGLPGMTVLQFAFDGKAINPHLPYNHVRRSVVYTGTHDNDTTAGWYEGLGEREAHRVRVYTGSDGKDIAWNLIRLAQTSVADLAIYPLQDVLSLGSWARQNSPGQAQANWAWRYHTAELDEGLAQGLAELTRVSGRYVPQETADAAAERANRDTGSA